MNRDCLAVPALGPKSSCGSKVKAVCCNQTACFADGEKLPSLCKALVCSRRLQILAEMLCHCSLAVGKCIYCRYKICPEENLSKQRFSLLNSVS